MTFRPRRSLPFALALPLVLAGCGRRAPYDASAWHTDALGRSMCFAAAITAEGDAASPASGHGTTEPSPTVQASASEATIVVDNVSGLSVLLVDGSGNVFGGLPPGHHAVLRLPSGSQFVFAFPARIEGFSLFGITNCGSQPCVTALAGPVKKGCRSYARLLAAVDRDGDPASKRCGELAKFETLRAPRTLGQPAGVWAADGGPTKKTREAAWYGRKQLETMPGAVQNTTLDPSLAWCDSTP